VTDFAALLNVLVGGRVGFVVSGGVGATAHGSAHVTVDLDVVYRRSAENIGRLAAALAPLAPYLRGAPPGLPFRFDVDTVRRGLNFTLTTTAGISTSSARLPAVAPTTPCFLARWCSRSSVSIAAS